MKSGNLVQKVGVSIPVFCTGRKDSSRVRFLGTEAWNRMLYTLKFGG